ncbi:MAG: nucleoside triphosphate pyrophosphohydrolase [Clostridiales bacterium]|nr:nucleoside triphosphate pyrophosphohydrolase [Clostridiales bacterium]
MIDFTRKEKYDLSDYRRIMEILRSEEGCPWDREQDHHSIRRNMLEEAYEVCEAIDEEDPEHLKEELGDVLMQVLFHARMEEEKGVFSIDDVADGACKKLIRRHPHVFGDTKVADSGEVLANWDQIKKQERAQESTSSVMDSVSRALPALWRAEKIQKKAAKVGFDWPDAGGAVDKLHEEVGELDEALTNQDAENIAEELGDILFCAVNICRFFRLDPESVLHASCEKFIRRFRFMEAGAQAAGRCLENMTLDEMEEIYQKARHDLEGKTPQL